MHWLLDRLSDVWQYICSVPGAFFGPGPGEDHGAYWEGWAVVIFTLWLALLLGSALFFKFHRPTKGERPKKGKRLAYWIRTVTLVSLLASAFLIGPCFYRMAYVEGIRWQGLYTLLASLQHVARMVAMDGSPAEVADMIRGVVESLSPGAVVDMPFYMGFMGALYALDPLLAGSAVLSYVSDWWGRVRFFFVFRRNIHVFSELNEKSLTLAESILTQPEGGDMQGRPYGRLVIFTDILPQDDEAHVELVIKAKEMGCYLFRKDICLIRLWMRRNRFHVYLIERDESEKLRHIGGMIEKYAARENVKLYVFSDSEESRSMLSSYSTEKLSMQVVRINDIRFLIYHNLDEHGVRLFCNAKPAAQSPHGLRMIRAAVVGLGKYGMEVVKALLWYCQLPGYGVQILAYDEDEDAMERFRAMCPEIRVGAAFLPDAGDMRYKLDIQTMHTCTKEFRDSVTAFDPTYVFVCLGTDAVNLATAQQIRRTLAGVGCYPELETVIYNASLKERSGFRYNDTPGLPASSPDAVPEPAAAPGKRSERQVLAIHVIGDVRSFYSVQTLLNSCLIEDGKRVHGLWDASDATFFMDDYCFYSSVSKALHCRLRTRMVEAMLAGEPGGLRPLETLVLPTSAAQLQQPEALLGYLLIQTMDLEKAGVLKACMRDDETKDGNIDRMLAYFSKNPAAKPFLIKKEGEEDDGILMTEEAIAFAAAANDGPACQIPFYSTRVDAAGQERELCRYEPCDMGTVMRVAKMAAWIDHVRWNAYMRTEGYCYSATGFGDNRKLKFHFNLVMTDRLTLADCIKDM